MIRKCECGTNALMDMLMRGDEIKSYFVRCNDDQGCGNMSVFSDTPEEAAKDWNERFDRIIEDDDIECPYCGDVINEDQHDYFGSSSDQEDIKCSQCGKKFRCYAEYSVTYSSAKVPCLNDHAHKWVIQDYAGSAYESRHCKHCRKREYRNKLELGATWE